MRITQTVRTANLARKAQLVVKAEMVNQEHKHPEKSAFAGTERAESEQCRQTVSRTPKQRSRNGAGAKIKKPTGRGKEESEAISAPGNVIDGGAMHRVDDPEERKQERYV